MCRMDSDSSSIFRTICSLFKSNYQLLSHKKFEIFTLALKRFVNSSLTHVKQHHEVIETNACFIAYKNHCLSHVHDNFMGFNKL